MSAGNMGVPEANPAHPYAASLGRNIVTYAATTSSRVRILVDAGMKS